MIYLPKPIEFDWDTGNTGKNQQKHRIEDKEAEEAFFDSNHILCRERYILLGKTKKRILLYFVFTLRYNKIRIISARKINKKEVTFYEKKA